MHTRIEHDYYNLESEQLKPVKPAGGRTYDYERVIMDLFYGIYSIMFPVSGSVLKEMKKRLFALLKKKSAYFSRKISSTVFFSLSGIRVDLRILLSK